MQDGLALPCQLLVSGRKMLAINEERSIATDTLERLDPHQIAAARVPQSGRCLSFAWSRVTRIPGLHPIRQLARRLVKLLQVGGIAREVIIEQRIAKSAQSHAKGQTEKQLLSFDGRESLLQMCLRLSDVAVDSSNQESKHYKRQSKTDQANLQRRALSGGALTTTGDTGCAILNSLITLSRSKASGNQSNSRSSGIGTQPAKSPE
jgi:hypothetical protein